MKKIGIFSKALALMLLMMIAVFSQSATITINTTTTKNWSTLTGGTGTSGLPGANDLIVILSGNLICDINATVSSLTFTGTSGKLTVNSGITLNVTNAITANNLAAISSVTITGSGIVNAGSVNVGSSTDQGNSSFTHELISSVSSLNVGTQISIISNLGQNGNRTANGKLSITGGTILVPSINLNNTGANNISTLTLDAATLNLSGTTPFTLSAIGTKTITLNNTGATVNYSVEAQTIYATTYTNLNLSGGVKTLGGNVTVGGTFNNSSSITAGSNTLTISGPFTNTGGSLTPGTGTVIYNGGAAQTVVPFTYNNLTLSGAGTKTLGGDITLQGNFTNSSNLNAGSSSITIAGTATQSIAGFSTTGGISMIKTGGTATFSGGVSAGTLTLNGSGGTLNLGAGLTHTISGLWTRTTGTLNGGSSTLKLGDGITNTGGAFTAGTGTVEYNGSTAQTISPLTYNNLTLSGSGTKTLGGNTTIGGDFTINSNITLDPSTYTLTLQGNFTNSGNAFTTANSSIINIGGTATQSIAGFSTTGGVSMIKTGGTATFSGSVSAGTLTINGSGGTLNLGVALTHTISGTLTMNTGTLDGGSSTLKLGGSVSGTGATFTASTGTVDYYPNAVQTIAPFTYNNLLISTPTGTPIKTLRNTTTVGGNLSIGTNTTLATGNFGLTLRSDFTNNGTFTAGSSSITLSGGTSQNIAGFSTTGLVTLNKSSGTATLAGNMSAGSLTINGGTLSLGAGKIHTISGALSMTSGTLDGATSTIKLGGSVSGSGATFTASTGTVEYNASAAQTIAPFTYNNLTLSTPSGTPIKTLGGITTVSGNLSIGSGVTLDGGTSTLKLGGSVSGTGAFTASTGTVEYNDAIAQMIAPFTYYNLTLSTPTGSSSKNLGVATTVGGNLSIGANTTLATSNYGLTLQGNFINNGTLTAGSSPITLSGGNTQNIAGFTTNGNVTVDKTTGTTATLSGALSVGGNLSVSSGTVNTGNNALTLQGNFTKSGTFTAGSSAITLSGGNTQNIAGISTTGTITVNKSANSATLTGNVDATNLTITAGQLIIPVGDQVTVTENTDIQPAEGLIIQSNNDELHPPVGTGSLITTTVSHSTTGTAKVERAMTSGAWHLVSAPVAGQPINDFFTANASIPTTVVSSTLRAMREYLPGSNQWGEFFNNGTTEPLAIGKGYCMRVKASTAHEIVFTGVLQAGDIAVGSLTEGKWNCIGNPYTSAININVSGTGGDNFLNVNAGTVPNIDPAYGIYIWHNLDALNGQTGKYTAISNVPVGVSYPVQQGQAFMVKMASGKTSVSFTKSMQVHDVSLELKSTENIWPNIQLMATGDSTESSTVIAFHEGMTNGLDPTYDAGLLASGGSMELYTRLVDDYGIPFAIQALPTEAFDQLIIPVGVDYTRGGAVTFSAKSVYLPSLCRPILEDRLTGIYTDLSDKTYSTDLTANTAGTGRFCLHTSYSTTGSASRDKASEFSAWAVGNNEININGRFDKGAMASLYDLQGRLIVTNAMREGISHRISLPYVNPGIYLLQVRDRQKVQAIKVTIGE